MRAKKKAEPQDNMVEILNLLEKEKGISKESLLQAIEDSLQQAYKYQHHTDNSLVTIDPETCQPHIYQVRKVVEEVEKFFPDQVFKTRIPRNVRLSEAPSFGEPVRYYDRLSKGAIMYDQLATEFLRNNKK